MRIRGRWAARGLVLTALVATLASAPGPVRAEGAPTELPDAEARAWQTGLVRTDRLHHFTISLTLSMGIGIAAGDGVAGAGGAFALGIAKELRDARTHHFDWVDLTADALGAALGGLVVSELVR